MTRPMPAAPAVTSTRRPLAEVSMAPMIAPPRRSRRPDLAAFLEFQLPELADRLWAEGVVHLGPRQLLEAGPVVDRPRRGEVRMRPKHQLLVALRAAERDALLDQAP